MDNAELRHAARKAGKVGEHHTPLLAEQIPDALIDLLFVGIWGKALGNQARKPVFRVTGIGQKTAAQDIPFCLFMKKGTLNIQCAFFGVSIDTLRNLTAAGTL
jgi:hypothetical protein